MTIDPAAAEYGRTYRTLRDGLRAAAWGLDQGFDVVDLPPVHQRFRVGWYCWLGYMLITHEDGEYVLTQPGLEIIHARVATLREIIDAYDRLESPIGTKPPERTDTWWVTPKPRHRRPGDPA